MQNWESETIKKFRKLSNLIVLKASRIAKHSVVKEKTDNGTSLADLRGNDADSF